MDEAQLLRTCRKLFLRGHVLDVRIGIHDFEQGAAQRMRFDVDLYVPYTQSDPSRDRIEDIVDYDFIRGVVRQRTAAGHINLQETLCDQIAADLLDNPHVEAVRVATAKLDVYPDCEAVGVEVFRLRGAQNSH
jgi:dihydroneopterin aldolase